MRIETTSGVQVRQLVLARGALSSSEPILHFGLGSDTRVDRMTVDWPSGQTQTFAGLRRRPEVHDHGAIDAGSAAAPGREANPAGEILGRTFQEPPVGEPFVKPLRPRRGGRVVARADAKTVADPGVDVQLGRHPCALEPHISFREAFRHPGAVIIPAHQEGRGSALDRQD